MTGPCPGAQTGVAKAGFAALQYIGPGAIGGALASLAGWQGAAVGASIGALTYDLTTFCPGGPPTPPTFTIGDITALLGGAAQPGYNAAAVKLRDFLGTVFWPILCECSSGGTPVFAGPSVYPTGAPNAQPVYPSSSPCYSFAGVTHAVVSAPSTQNYGDYFPTGGKQPTLYTAQVTASTGSGYQYLIGFRINDGTTVTPYKLAGPFSAGTLANVAIPIPQGYIKEILFDVYHDAGTQSGTCNITLSGQLYCNGEQPGLQSPCCPPDPALQAQVDAILNMVTLIQRQAVPFGYIASTAHTGLSGAGAISISGLLGVRVAVTTLPASYGVAGTSPPEHFDLGYITFGTPDGFPSAYRLTRNPQVMMPARCGVYTDLDYDLAPGVVVTITELLREP